MSPKKKLLSIVNIFIAFILLCSNCIFAKPSSVYKLAARSQVSAVAGTTKRLSHLVRNVTEIKDENFLYGMKIKRGTQWIVPDGKKILKGVEKIYREWLGMAKEHIERLEHIYGKGITALVDRILIVSNLAGDLYGKGRAPLASYKDGVLKIDAQLFSGTYRFILFETLEHEFLESIAEVVPNSNEALSDVVATYRNVLRFLKPNEGVKDSGKYGWSKRDYKSQLLASLRPPIDPDGKYQELLYFLDTQKNLTEDTIILAVVRYVLITKSYEKVRDQLGLPDELARKIKEISINLDTTLAALNELASKDDQAKTLIAKVKTADLSTMHAVKTLAGIRVSGLDNISEDLNGMIRAEARQISNMDRLSGKLVKQSTTKYILVSKDRIKSIEETEYEKIAAKLRENNYVICTERPNTDDKNIINLVDPGDHATINQQENMFYLLMPYTRSSLYIAALVLQAGRDCDALDQLVKQLILDLYPGLEQKDLSEFFTSPWNLLPKIQPVIDNIENLRKAIAILEQAA